MLRHQNDACHTALIRMNRLISWSFTVLGQLTLENHPQTTTPHTTTNQGQLPPGILYQSEIKLRQRRKTT